MSTLPLAAAAPAVPCGVDDADDADSRWAALDDPAEWPALGRPLPDASGCWESFLAIEGMHCAGCTLLVEQALGRLEGVRSVQVNGATQAARLVWVPGASRPSDWMRALRQAGYGAVPASDLLDAATRTKARRLMLWRWLVAGFCMMQAMMYALPLYVAAPGEITPDIETLLRWGAWMMTLPVILFACWPFFAGAWRDLRHRRIGMDVPVSLGILIAFAASSAATFDPGAWGDEIWYDSVTMFVFFLLSGRLLEQRLRDRTAGSLQALMRSLPATVERERADGSLERVPVRGLRVGDRIRLRPGDVIPADGRIEAGESRVDEALLTGESEPLARRVGDAVIAGSHNLAGTLTVRVQGLGQDTRFAGIVALMERVSLDKPRLAQLADRIARPFLLAVLLAAGLAAAWWWPVDPVHAVSVAVAVLIVTCPCALSLATPAATLTTAGALARRGVLVRQLQALDGAARVDTVVFDKTGTLTRDAMALTGVKSRAGVPEAEALAAAAAVASASLHPLSRALVGAAGRQLPAVGEVREQPGRGLEARLLTGALSASDPRGRPLRLGSAAFCGIGDGPASGPQVHLADAQGWLASFSFDEGLREDAVQAVAQLRGRGLDVRLWSGDRPAAVRRLARRAGIAHWQAACSPEDKLARLRELQRQGRRVLMVGDGMNDGPVLAAADVSVAMGHAVPLAQARCDFIVQGGQVSAVVELLLQARRSARVVRQNLAWAALYNAACVPLAVVGLMPPWLAGLGMAGSSLAVVLNAARLARLPKA